MHRSMNLILTLFLIPPMAIPFLIISLIIKITSRGPILHWSTRVGRDNKTFKMPKFRTMYVNTPVMATHKLNNPNSNQGRTNCHHNPKKIHGFDILYCQMVTANIPEHRPNQLNLEYHRRQNLLQIEM